MSKLFLKISLTLVMACTLLLTNQNVLADDYKVKDSLFGEKAQTMQDQMNSNEVKGALDDARLGTSSNLIVVILGWIRFILPYASIFAFIGIVYAGFLYVTGFAQEDNIEKAKNILMWSVIGLLLIFAAYVLVGTFIKPTG